MPEKSGIDAALCAPGLAGAAVGANCCAEARVIAATVASNRKCRCIFMSTSPSWSTQDARPHEVAVPSILYQNRNRRAAGRYTDEPLSDDGSAGQVYSHRPRDDVGATLIGVRLRAGRQESQCDSRLGW